MNGGNVHPLGGDAHRLLDNVIRDVPSFTDGVRNIRSFWSDGISRRAATLFTARAYSAILGPLMSSLSPDVLPCPEMRVLLIHCLELVMLFFSVARAPTAQYGGLHAVKKELMGIAELLANSIKTTFSGKHFKAGGAEDMEFYKLHMLLPEHLGHFLSNFGPLWDTSLSTAEACGQLLKLLYLSTNRHSKDVANQVSMRFNEQFFLTKVLPRYTPSGLGGGGSAGGGRAAQTSGAERLFFSQPVVPLRVSWSTLFPAASFTAAWASFIKTSCLGLSALNGYSITWFREARLRRHSAWRAVCNVDVGRDCVVLQYLPAALKKMHVELAAAKQGGAGDAVEVAAWLSALALHHSEGSAYAHRSEHDHTLQQVEHALLLQPLAFFTAVPLGAGAGASAALQFCVAHQYEPLLAGTARSAEFTLHKPRKLNLATIVIVPVSELSHPLRYFPYREAPSSVPWSKENERVPVPANSLATANAVLVSTRIGW